MNNLWKINDIDLYSTFGAYIFKGNYNELLAPPMPRKRLEHEYIDRDGFSVDTITPLTYEAKRFNLKIGIKGSSAADFWSNYNALFSELSQAGNFDLYIADLDKHFTLLYEGVAKTEKLTPIETRTGQVCATFEIKCLEPLQDTHFTSNADLVLVVNGVVSIINNPSTVFTITDDKLYLNLD